MASEAIATIVAAVVGVVGTGIVGYLQYRTTRSTGSTPPTVETIGSQPAGELVVTSRFARIKEERLLRCGSIKHPPLADFTYTGRSCSFSGLYVEMARAVGEVYDFQVEFAAVDWADLSTAFSEMNLDLVLSVFETKRRLEYADFVGQFHKIGVSGVVRRGSNKIQGVEDLHKPDVRVVVTKGEAGWEYVVADLKVPKHRLIVVENSNISEMIGHIVGGHADIAICDDISCYECVSANPELEHRFLEDSLYLCKNGIMVPKGDPEFAAWIDHIFSNIRNTPAIATTEAAILTTAPRLIRRFR